MVNQQLVDWIKSEVAKGNPKESIEKTLASQGWQVADINDAFNFLYPQQAVQPAASGEWGADQPKKESMLPVIIIGVVCVLLLVAAGIYKWLNP